jgi:opacity protein-like surface antigen
VFTDNGTVLGSDEFVTGYQLGLGVEYALSESTHLRGTVSHYMFDDGDYLTDVLYTGIGMDATVVEIGVLFRF